MAWQGNFTFNSTNQLLPLAPTLDPGHEAIFEMHANSESNAIFYVVVVLGLYVLALVAVLTKYLRSEHYEARLSRLYDEFVRRDRRVATKQSNPTSLAPPSEGKRNIREKKQVLVDKMVHAESNV